MAHNYSGSIIHNQSDFARALLSALGIAPSAGATKAIVGWENAEGGNWHNNARYNPLNTTQPEPGAGNTGSQGNIKVYRDWAQGVQATADTLRNGRYGGILSALKAGSPGSAADAIGSSPWGTASGLVHQTIGGASVGSAPRTSGEEGIGSTPDYQSVTTPAHTDQQARSAALLQWMATRGQPGSTASLLDALRGAQTPSQTQIVQTPGSTASSGTGPVSSHGGTAVDPSGKRVANWIEPILAYARQHGWQGAVNSGYRSDAEQTKIYNSGVRPAALPRSLGGGGSNHEFTAFPGGAVDVSQAQQLAQILQGSPYKGKLVYAGAKDPVHFSHPHGGSY